MGKYIQDSVCLLYVRQCAYVHYVITKVVETNVSIKCYLPVSTLLSEKNEVQSFTLNKDMWYRALAEDRVSLCKVRPRVAVQTFPKLRIPTRLAATAV